MYPRLEMLYQEGGARRDKSSTKAIDLDTRKV